MSVYRCIEESDKSLYKNPVVEGDEEPIVTYNAPGFISKISRVREIFTGQQYIGNGMFLEKFIKQNISNVIFWDEIEKCMRYNRAPTANLGTL